jgi:hypothetical protein
MCGVRRYLKTDLTLTGLDTPRIAVAVNRVSERDRPLREIEWVGEKIKHHFGRGVEGHASSVCTHLDLRL